MARPSRVLSTVATATCAANSVALAAVLLGPWAWLTLYATALTGGVAFAVGAALLTSAPVCVFRRETQGNLAWLTVLFLEWRGLLLLDPAPSVRVGAMAFLVLQAAMCAADAIHALTPRIAAD